MIFYKLLIAEEVATNVYQVHGYAYSDAVPGGTNTAGTAWSTVVSEYQAYLRRREQGDDAGPPKPSITVPQSVIDQVAAGTAFEVRFNGQVDNSGPGLIANLEALITQRVNAYVTARSGLLDRWGTTGTIA